MQTVATEYAKKAYLEIKTIPIRSVFFNDYDSKSNLAKCTCGLAAIYIYEVLNGGSLDEFWSRSKTGSDVISYFRQKGYSKDYLNGFTSGFDGGKSHKCAYQNDEMYKEFLAGYKDGENTWEEVKFLGSAEGQVYIF